VTEFADLHAGPLPLLLPNAWDVPSALSFVAAGYRAIGTTSLGMAASHGVPDGGQATRESNLTLARSLTRLPALVTVDSEDGYSDDPADVAAYVAELSALGVVGVNLEDSTAGRLVEPSVFAAKAAAVKQSAPDVFVNARVDTYWFHQDDTVEATLARATAYVEAGADGIFVPGVGDADTIRALTAALPPRPGERASRAGSFDRRSRRARRPAREHGIAALPRLPHCGRRGGDRGAGRDDAPRIRVVRRPPGRPHDVRRGRLTPLPPWRLNCVSYVGRLSHVSGFRFVELRSTP
jgi:hypothetical protein